MGELAKDYEGSVEFNIISAEETARRPDEIEAYGFTDLKHGLVGFSTDGEALIKMPGHQFGREEIEAAVTQLLSGS